MRIRQSPLKFLERDVWVLMDQLDQKVMVGGEPSITGVARVIGRRQAQPLLELLSKARRRCSGNHQSTTDLTTCQTLAKENFKTGSNIGRKRVVNRAGFAGG